MKRLLAVVLVLWGVEAQAAKSQEMRDIRVSEAQPTASGTWQHVLRRSAQAWACSETAAAGKCLEHTVTVNNQSGETLVCQLRVDFKRGGAVVKQYQGPALVLPRTSPELNSTLTDDQTEAEISSLECLARAPYKRIPKVAGCKYDMMGKPFESYYPPEARLNSQQGPVIISFLLGQRLGPAQEVTIAESSLVPLLDEAALRFIRDQDFRTNCPGQRFDVLMRFKLRDQVLAGAN
jgi:TonB family protein